jgi:hypothetical protein
MSFHLKRERGLELDHLDKEKAHPIKDVPFEITFGF